MPITLISTYSNYCNAGHDPWAALGGVKSPVDTAASASAPAQPPPWNEFDGAAATAMATNVPAAAPAVEGATNVYMQ